MSPDGSPTVARVAAGADPSRRTRISEFVLFGAIALALLVLFAQLGGFSVAERDLLGGDSYMRFLRIERLWSSGDWFSSFEIRSNYPFGESSHWTRPLDALVVGLAAPLAPFLGGQALYWGAIASGPILLLVLGGFTRWGFGEFIGEGAASYLMPVILGFPLVLSYLGLGRVDHHGLILVILVLTMGFVLRLATCPRPIYELGLGFTLGLGLWTSTEFLVPWVLTFVTLALIAVKRGDPRRAWVLARSFCWAAPLLAAAIAAERRGVFVVEYDKISIVHLLLAAAAALSAAALAIGIERSSESPTAWLIPALVGGIAGSLLLLLFPGLVGGPFSEVDPQVAITWLQHVSELQPVSFADMAALSFRLGPMVLALVAGSWTLARTAESTGHRTSLAIVSAWVVFYACLAALQFRWALFGHILSVPLLVGVLPLVLKRFDRIEVLVRPVIIASLVAFPILVAGGTNSQQVESASGRCDVNDVLAALREQPRTTILAEQDVGPELLYRTDHRVIATPYHRNEGGLIYMADIFTETVMPVVEERLKLRDVGLVLVCPGPRWDDPSDSQTSFHELLVEDSPPPFMRRLVLPGQTDYLLYAVEH